MFPIKLGDLCIKSIDYDRGVVSRMRHRKEVGDLLLENRLDAALGDLGQNVMDLLDQSQLKRTLVHAQDIEQHRFVQLENSLINRIGTGGNQF